MKTLKTELLKIHTERGMNSLYSYMKKNNISYEQKIVAFGLENKTNSKKKYDFLQAETPDNEIRLHHYSMLVHSKGWNYNRLLARQIIIKSL